MSKVISGDADRLGRRLSKFERSILAVTCLMVLAAFAWSAKSGLIEARARGVQCNYYNLLARALRAGQLNLQVEPPPGFTQLADPYDPASNKTFRLMDGQPLHDLSYYKGNWYLYFGITPALLLFGPWAAVTGRYLSHRDAVLIFASVGFLAGAVLLRAIWRRYFRDVSVGVIAAGTLALGLASYLPIILARSDIYEVAVSCGSALTMLALGGLWCALHDPSRRGWWLAAASLACGLAVGARPSLLFVALILVVPVAAPWSERRNRWGLLLAAAVPLLLVGLGLAAYNTMRFDNPFEFGLRYELSAFREDRVEHFSLRYLWFGFRAFFLEPARWAKQWPFVRDAVLPMLPPGYAETEHPFGVLTNIPVVWLALAAPLAWRRRNSENRSLLRAVIGVIAFVFGSSAFVICLHNSACIRYTLEFVPTLMLLAVVGMFALEREARGWQGRRHVVRGAWIFLLVGSMTFNLLAGASRQEETQLDLANLFLFGRDQPGQAVEYYHLALRIRPANAEARNNLGLALAEQGNLPEASAEFSEAIRLKPAYAEAHYNLGNTLATSGKLSDARAQYLEAVHLNPAFADAHFQLGSIFIVQGDAEEALRHFGAALQSAPVSSDTLARLGRALAVAEAAGQTNAVASLRTRLSLYQPQQPFGQPN